VFMQMDNLFSFIVASCSFLNIPMAKCGRRTKMPQQICAILEIFAQCLCLYHILQAVHHTVQLAELLPRTPFTNRIKLLIKWFAEYFKVNGIDKWIKEQGGWGVSLP